MKCKHCDLPVVSRPMPMVPGQTKPSGVYWAHEYGDGMLIVFGWSPYNHHAEPASFPLYIHLHQTGKWERQECATVEGRDYLRAVWRSAGHCTAVGV